MLGEQILKHMEVALELVTGRGWRCFQVHGGKANIAMNSLLRVILVRAQKEKRTAVCLLGNTGVIINRIWV